MGLKKAPEKALQDLKSKVAEAPMSKAPIQALTADHVGHLRDAKDFIFGMSDEPEFETALVHLKAVPGSEQLQSELLKLKGLWDIASNPSHPKFQEADELFGGGDQSKNPFIGFEKHFDQFAKERGSPPIPHPEEASIHGTVSTHLGDTANPTRTHPFLKDLDTVAMQTGRTPDELLHEYFVKSPEPTAISSLVQKHDIQDELDEALEDHFDLYPSPGVK